MKLSQWREGALVTVLASAVAGMAWAGWQWQGASRVESELAALAANRDIPAERRASATPEIQLARALYLARAGRNEDAQDLLDYLASRGDGRIRGLALYDLGNLRLRQAMAKVEEGSAERAMPLVEIAKSAYRQSLALDPGHWDGKYNLELAMRLMPEMDRVSNGEDELPPEAQKRIWTGVPGFPRGLP